MTAKTRRWWLVALPLVVVLAVVFSKEALLMTSHILIKSGETPWLVDEAEKVLVENYRHVGLYQRGDFLVQVVVASADDDPRKYVRRPPGSVILRRATTASLLDVLEREICWEFKDEEGKLHRTNCPAKVAQRYLSRVGNWHVPVLVGIVEAPVMRPDGSVLTEPGYDERTGLLLESTTTWRAPPSLSDEAVAAAVKCLKKPFAQFPLSEAGRSVVISAILTGLQRRLLYSAPMHGFDAPKQGSGKTLLADCVAIVATGRDAPAISANIENGQEEFRQKLMSGLIAGDAIVCIDNITRPLESDTLASILTKDKHKDRVLGVMENAEVPTNVLFLPTGNNLQFSGDMPSRVLCARIEPNCEFPEERDGFEIRKLRNYMKEHRVELVTAAMTILQGFHFKKDERPVVKPFGRFEQWSEEIREAMIWAGLTDPCETRKTIIEADPERDRTLAVYQTWHNAYTEATTLRDLTRIAVGFINSNGHEVEGDIDLRSALLEIAADPKSPQQVDQKLLGNWCRLKAGNIVGGFTLLRVGKVRGGFMTWRVAQMEKVEAAAASETNHKAAEAQPPPAKPEPVVEKEFESF